MRKKMPKKAKEKKVSPYQTLNKWLYDGSKNTQMPEDLVNDKAIPQTIILYHFQASHYGLYVSEIFNNFGLYQMEKVDVFRFLKDAVRLTGYKPPFITRMKTEKTKIGKALKMKFPFLKMYEINMLVDQIDNSEEKDRVYESLGFYKPKKRKSTKADKKMLEELKVEDKNKISIDSVMGNFS